jgi:hypothetical protein
MAIVVRSRLRLANPTPVDAIANESMSPRPRHGSE